MLSLDDIFKRDKLILIITNMSMPREGSKPLLCLTHPKKEIKYFCFERMCINSLESCILCIKLQHINCSESLILDKEQIVDLVRKSSSADSGLLHHIRDSYKGCYSGVKNYINLLVDKEIVEINRKFIEKHKSSTQEFLTKKSEYIFRYNKDTKKIIANSDVSVNNQRFNDILQYIDNDLKVNIGKMIKGVNNYSTIIRLKFTSADFVSHEKLKILQENEKIIFSIPQSSEEYYQAILNYPVVGDMHFKVKVFNLNPNDRYVEMGFLKSNEYKSYKEILKGTILLGTVSYCGYRFAGFEGPPPKIPVASELGLQNEDEVFFKYEHSSKIITVYSEAKSWQYKAKVRNDVTYYLYFSIYFTDQRFELTHV